MDLLLTTKVERLQVREATDMAIWRFKSCPRCSGDMFLDRDDIGWHEECLQCSHLVELEPTSISREQQLAEKEKELALAGGVGGIRS